MRRIDQILQRLEEIRNMMAAPDYDEAQSEALLSEVRSLNQERADIEARAAHTAELRRQVGADTINQILRQEKARGAGSREPENPAASPEYRRAWLKNLAVRDGVHIFGDMTTEERAAFTVTTGNTGAVVPTQIMNRIIELVESMAPMYDDATISNMSNGFGIPRHKSIQQGDAKGVAEGTANDDEKDEFELLSLSGVEIKKHIVLSRAMKFKSIDAFESWVVRHLSERISVAKESLILARLDGKAPSGGSVAANAGIAAANILTGQTYTDATIRSIFAKLKGRGVRVIYANSATIWNHLAGIEDGDHRKLFVPNSMEDPITQGRIYGGVVKEDNNLADHVVYFGVRGKLLVNEFDDLEIFSTIEAKTANDIKTAYSLTDAGLENPESFVKATFTTSTAGSAGSEET